MKKIIVFILLFFLTSCSSITDVNPIDCKDNNSIGGVCVDLTKPKIIGIEDVTIERGATFNPLLGVSVIDDLDGDITDALIVIEQIDTSETGTYLVKYNATDKSGNETFAIRYVTVEFTNYELKDNLVLNGSFENGLSGFTNYQTENGTFELELIDQELKVVIYTKEGSNSWEPRLDYRGILFEQGKSYQVSFDMRALEERPIKVLIGELINTEPWFYHFSTEVPSIQNITTELTTYTFTFTMSNGTCHNGAILFEFGRINGQNYDTTIFLDNIVIKEIIGE